MRSLTTAILCFCTMICAAQQQQILPKLSPLTKRYLHNLDKEKQQVQSGYIYNKNNDGKTYVSALIKVADATTAQAGLDGIGAKVGTKAGRVWTVKVPVENVRTFTTLAGIYYIQLDEPTQPHLDIARKTTRTDSAHAGYNLPMGYSGQGVVVGVIDFGFDYNHPTLYDTLGSTYRVKRVWEVGTNGTPPAGYSYGNELTDTNAMKGAGTDNAKQTHGSLTTGMAAGSGYGSAAAGKRFRGMAYQSDIVLVGVRRDSIGGQWMEGSFSDFIDGVNYIFNYATSVGKPAVVNISWGSQSGSHDGTSLFNEACDNLSGAGKIIVMSAGNEGEERIHISKTFSATDTVVKTYLTFNPTTYKRTWVDIWGQPGKTWCAKTTLFSGGVAGNTTGYMCINDDITDTFLVAANGIDTCFVQVISETAAATNTKPRMTINIYNKATDTVGISVKSNSGAIDMWDEYYYYGFPYKFQSAFDSVGDATAVRGNTASTVSDMGSAQSVLLVGAYASKVAFTDINGNNWSYGGYVPANRLVPFSSRGPMADGRIKPDITAPGLTIATSMSSYDTSHTATGTNSSGTISKVNFNGKDYYYCEFSGTSASAPAASGIVALLLQASPTLTPAQMKSYIFSTAITDANTGVLPAAGTNNWGHGKINAYGALRALVHDVSVQELKGRKLDCVVFPNPNNGSFVLDYNGDRAEQLSVSVHSVSGQLVYAKQWQVNTGSNRVPIDMSAAAKGVYIIDVKGEGGSVSMKAVVQ